MTPCVITQWVILVDMPEQTQRPSLRASGRPVTIDPEAVARQALELFATRGYDAVSMAEIAAEAGIGRKSLYRYFESKAAIVWGGALGASDVSDRVLEESVRNGVGVEVGLLASTAAIVDSLPDLEVTRGRLRLISEHAELMAQSPLIFEEQRGRVEDYLVQCGAPQEEAHYLSVAYSTVNFAAWIRWARGVEDSPVNCLARALEVLRFPQQ